MNYFDAWGLTGITSRLQHAIDALTQIVSVSGGGSDLGTFAKSHAAILRDVCAFARSHEFDDLETFVNSCVRAIDKGQHADASSIKTDFEHSLRILHKESFFREFLIIAGDRKGMLDSNALFGEAVNEAFPSARFDIQQSGNCLAVECSDAAVFHLMHVAEHGLRALARDRRIRLPKTVPLSLGTWEEVLKKLEEAEAAIQQYPKTLTREAQFDFYHGAMMEFKRFKNKFRNRIMHTRERYDRDQAHSAFVHVREFMKILSQRISETKRTPLIWKGSKWLTMKES